MQNTTGKKEMQLDPCVILLSQSYLRLIVNTTQGPQDNEYQGMKYDSLNGRKPSKIGRELTGDMLQIGQNEWDHKLIQ